LEHVAQKINDECHRDRIVVKHQHTPYALRHGIPSGQKIETAGSVGSIRREDAVSKVAEASSLAREHGHPLMLRYCWGDAVAPVLSRAKMAVFNWLKRMDKVVWKAFWQGV
jgi:hypothetical protein